MKNTPRLLFKNTVYSIDPERPEEQFIGPDPLYYRIIADSSDTELFDIVQSTLTPQKWFFSPVGIFQKDIVLTHVWKAVRKSQARYISPEGVYNLSCARNIITDDNYPVFIEYIRKFKRMTAKRRMSVMMGNFTVTFGRLPLLEIIEAAKYEPAIPELCEIVLHDRDHRMVKTAVSALRDIQTRKSFQGLNTILLNNELPFWKKDHLSYVLKNNTSKLLLPGLRKIFEDEYLHFPKEYEVVYHNCTIQQNILTACSQIPTVSALQFLETGIKHPYDHVERTAYHSIKAWIKIMLDRIRQGKDDGHGLLLAKIIKRYDFQIFNESYKKLKKQSTDFRF